MPTNQILLELSAWRARAEKAEKELAEVKAGRDAWKNNCDDMEELIHSLRKELAKLKDDNNENAGLNDNGHNCGDCGECVYQSFRYSSKCMLGIKMINGRG